MTTVWKFEKIEDSLADVKPWKCYKNGLIWAYFFRREDDTGSDVYLGTKKIDWDDIQEMLDRFKEVSGHIGGFGFPDLCRERRARE